MSTFEILSLIGLLGTVIVPFLIYAMSAQSKRIEILEKRQYEMNKDLVTKEMLEKAEERITSNMDTQIQMISAGIQTVISQNQLLINSLNK